MKKYENGMSTKKIILHASRQLFLEKGFHETSSEDICRAAHVNRSAIHYHFKDKENLRYEIIWELLTDCRAIAAKYCDDPRLQATTAIYLTWCQAALNPKIRRFHVDYARDYPVYIPNQPLPTYYRLLYHYIFEELWPMERISDLGFSAIYGHLMSIMQLADTHPERYTGRELFLHGMKACFQSWEIPEEQGRLFWRKMLDCIDALPPSVMDNLKAPLP